MHINKTYSKAVVVFRHFITEFSHIVSLNKLNFSFHVFKVSLLSTVCHIVSECFISVEGEWVDRCTWLRIPKKLYGLLGPGVSVASAQTNE